MRGSPKRGCGSPKAADSPKTRIRTMSGGFWRGMEIAAGMRAAREPKNRQPNWSFWTKVFSPWSNEFRRNAVGYPKPDSRRPNSSRPRQSSGTPARAVNRKHHSFCLNNGEVGPLVILRFGFRRLMIFKTYQSRIHFCERSSYLCLPRIEAVFSGKREAEVWTLPLSDLFLKCKFPLYGVLLTRKNCRGFVRSLV